ncbi:MAG: cytochrome c maturation protein CcmE [Gammaproteobacteria bacterium]|nr:cytochrome c maturation protein CcmE [Gammaproteobacteria bacterium]
MKSRHKRLAFVIAGLAGLAGAAALVMNAFNDNMVFFFSPTQVLAKEAPEGRAFRLGGLVEKGSLKREDDGLTVHFVVTDMHKTIPVTYKGILPDLFKEGQGVVAQGKLETGGVFRAEEVLAKHDENYMPPEVKKALDEGKNAAAKAGSVQQ